MHYSMLAAALAPAHASAPNTIVVVRSPIHLGIFDSFAVAHPSYHHTPWGGDWATDFYGAPGSDVRFDVRELNAAATPGDAYGVIVANYSACGSPYDVAGTAYQIDVYDGAGAYVGWVLYAHVDTWGVGLLPIGTVLGSGTILGQTAQWAYSNCYQVNNAYGVHTHVELYNASDYACYVPWASGTVLGQNRRFGGLGSSNAGPGEPCW